MKSITRTSFIGISPDILLNDMKYCILVFLCCIITGLCSYSSGKVSSSETSNAHTNKSKKQSKNKWLSNPAIPKMAERIEKKVHASYKLQPMSPKNQYIRNIFMKDAKECSRLYYGWSTPYMIAASRTSKSIAFVIVKEVTKMPYHFVGYYSLGECIYLIDKSMQPLMTSPEGEKRALEFDYIIHYYTEGAVPIDDSGWPCYYSIDKDSI